MFAVKKQRLRLCGSGIFVLTLAAYTMAQTAPREAANPAKETANTSSNLVVAKDPATGALRAPTAAEMQALQPAANPTPQKLGANGRLAAGPQTFVLPEGGIGVTLDESTMNFMVARKNPDGTISLGEAVGRKAADKAISTAPAGKAAPGVK